MDLTKHLTTRADDGHARSVTELNKALSPFGKILGISNPGKVHRLHRIKEHDPPLVRVPVNSLMF